MGIFNEHSDTQKRGYVRGTRGAPGVGFSLTKDGNYDMINKKLKNVGEGVESSDAITKHQLEVAIILNLIKFQQRILSKKIHQKLMQILI